MERAGLRGCLENLRPAPRRALEGVGGGGSDTLLAGWDPCAGHAPTGWMGQAWVFLPVAQGSLGRMSAGQAAKRRGK